MESVLSDMENNIVTSSDGLAALYKQPIEHIATKDLDYVNAAGRAFIAASPFLVLATGSRQGLDGSPKGDRLRARLSQGERGRLASLAQLVGSSLFATDLCW